MLHFLRVIQGILYTFVALISLTALAKPNLKNGLKLNWIGQKGYSTLLKEYYKTHSISDNDGNRLELFFMERLRTVPVLSTGTSAVDFSSESHLKLFKEYPHYYFFELLIASAVDKNEEGIAYTRMIAPNEIFSLKKLESELEALNSAILAFNDDRGFIFEKLFQEHTSVEDTLLALEANFQKIIQEQPYKDAPLSLSKVFDLKIEDTYPVLFKKFFLPIIFDEYLTETVATRANREALKVDVQALLKTLKNIRQSNSLEILNLNISQNARFLNQENRKLIASTFLEKSLTDLDNKSQKRLKRYGLWIPEAELPTPIVTPEIFIPEVVNPELVTAESVQRWSFTEIKKRVQNFFRNAKTTLAERYNKILKKINQTTVVEETRVPNPETVVASDPAQELPDGPKNQPLIENNIPSALEDASTSTPAGQNRPIVRSEHSIVAPLQTPVVIKPNGSSPPLPHRSILPAIEFKTGDVAFLEKIYEGQDEIRDFSRKVAHLKEQCSSLQIPVNLRNDFLILFWSDLPSVEATKQNAEALTELLSLAIFRENHAHFSPYNSHHRNELLKALVYLSEKYPNHFHAEKFVTLISTILQKKYSSTETVYSVFSGLLIKLAEINPCFAFVQQTQTFPQKTVLEEIESFGAAGD